MKHLVLKVALLMASSAVFAAEVEFEMQGPPSLLSFNGPIETGDLNRLKGRYEQVEEKVHPDAPWASRTVLIVNSEGGSVNESLNIGRWIRENRITVMIAPDGRCFSACVYLLAAGVKRDPSLGEVGIHRPFFTKAPEGDITTFFRTTLNASRTFFEEMNIPPSLADDMYSTPPESMRILTETELRKYRLNQTDMAYREREDLADAEYYGMSRLEYLEAKGKADFAIELLCKDIPDNIEFLRCIEEINEGQGLVPASE